MLGVTIDPHHKSHTHAGIVDYYIDIFHNIASVRYQDAVLGLVCCAILLSLRVGGQMPVAVVKLRAVKRTFEKFSQSRKKRTLLVLVSSLVSNNLWYWIFASA